MVPSSSKTDLDVSTRKELQAAIKFLTQRLHEMTGKPPTSEQLIEVLRERGQASLADELERLVAQIRAERKSKKTSGLRKGRRETVR